MLVGANQGEAILPLAGCTDMVLVLNPCFASIPFPGRLRTNEWFVRSGVAKCSYEIKTLWIFFLALNVFSSSLCCFFPFGSFFLVIDSGERERESVATGVAEKILQSQPAHNVNGFSKLQIFHWSQIHSFLFLLVPASITAIELGWWLRLWSPPPPPSRNLCFLSLSLSLSLSRARVHLPCKGIPHSSRRVRVRVCVCVCGGVRPILYLPF